ncbi:MAG: hypothetical protein HY928_05790 [Elusimicrobia bacterium]|nr:hypothetical protein [Elusimicrobiota bacterium]
MKRAVAISKGHPGPRADLDYWRGRPAEERIAAMTRMTRLAWTASGRKFPDRIARTVRIVPGHE